jgi:hypothetical protein
MIPSSFNEEGILLYKAQDFPYNWTLDRVLFEGHYNDPSIFFYNNQWWMFVERKGTLRLFYSEDLKGIWYEHPKSPLIKDNFNITRGGGRILVLDDKIIRYTQDVSPTYGNQVRAFLITKLTNLDYSEEEYSDNPIINMTGKGWNADGMHHIDSHQISDNQWIACVDGFDRNYYLSHPIRRS